MSIGVSGNCFARNSYCYYKECMQNKVIGTDIASDTQLQISCCKNQEEGGNAMLFKSKAAKRACIVVGTKKCSCVGYKNKKGTRI